MEELDNIEGIGMDKEEIHIEFEDINVKPKRKRVEPKLIVRAKQTTVDKVKMFMGRCGGNSNCIAAQLGISKSIVEQIISDENLQSNS